MSLINYKFSENKIAEMAQSGFFKIYPDGTILKSQRVRGKTSLDEIYKITDSSVLVVADRIIPSGYKQVRIMINKHVFYAFSHRIVWTYFNGIIPNEMQVNHLNGIKGDNRLSNLELVTTKENKDYSSKVFGTWNGEKNGMNKLHKEDVVVIYKRAVNGENHRIIASEYNISRVTVSDILCHRTWKCLNL